MGKGRERTKKPLRWKKNSRYSGTGFVNETFPARTVEVFKPGIKLYALIK
jgi:hypothetical protein